LASHYSGVPEFVENAANDPMGTFALQLVAVRDDVVHSMGTAMLIAPGIALTAGHVIAQCDKAFGRPIETGHGRHSNFVLHAMQYAESGDVRAMSIARVVTAGFTDLALLQLRADPAWMPPGYPRLNLAPPHEGDKVFACGYAGTATLDGDNIVVTRAMHTSTGKVIEVHADGRDRVIAPFPCFHVDARFDDAMSGGPVLDQEGRLCGVICSSMPPGEGESVHSSLVTLLWPLAGLEVDIQWEHRSRFKLYEFFQARGDGVLGLERVRLHGDVVSLLPAAGANS
jgi:hypothetical protein